jgi:hypothetical protein
LLIVKVSIMAWLVAGTFFASAATAQSQTNSEPISAGRTLRIPLIIWATGVAADQITTYQFTHQYRDMMHEENLLIRSLDQHPALLVAAGTAIDATSGWLAYRVLRRHPRLAHIAFYGAAAYRGYLAVHNMQMMRRAEQLRAAASGASCHVFLWNLQSQSRTQAQ